MAHADRRETGRLGDAVNAGLPTVEAARSGSRLGRNMGLNILGQVVPAVIGLAAVPYILHGMGLARFGVLSLAWVVLAYLGLFDFGLGRATIRFVAEAFGRGDEAALPGIVWTSLLVQVGLGLAGSAILAVATPVLVERALRVPAALLGDTRAVFYVLSAAIPVLLCSASLKGVLEASGRFDLTNLVRSGSGSLLFLVPALGVAAHTGLPTILLMLLGALVLTAAAYLVLCLRVHPSLARPRAEPGRLRELFTFGGWVTVSSLVVPFLIYSDRFLLTAIAGVATLAYYTIPFDVVSRLQVLPGSLGTAIFPAFSTASAGDRARVTELYLRGLRYLAAVLCPVALVLVVGANLFLGAWLGRSFAEHGTVVLQLLAAGVVLNAMSQIPAQLVDGVGRPDLRAKVLAGYLLPYLALAVVLISWWGVRGAAVAWLARGCAELVLFFWFAGAQLGLSARRLLRERFVIGLVAFAVLAAAGALAARITHDDLAASAAVTAGATLVLAAIVWTSVLEPAERSRIRLLAAGLGTHIGFNVRTTQT